MTWLTLCLAYFALAACLHAILRRMGPGANTVVLFLGAGAAAGILLLVSLHCLIGISSLQASASACLFAFLCELYLFGLTFVFGSVSASVLLSHLDRTGARAGDARASPEAMVGRRLAGLCASGLLVEQGGAYHVTALGRLAVCADGALGTFFGHERAALSHKAP